MTAPQKKESILYIAYRVQKIRGESIAYHPNEHASIKLLEKHFHSRTWNDCPVDVLYRVIRRKEHEQGISNKQETLRWVLVTPTSIHYDHN